MKTIISIVFFVMMCQQAFAGDYRAETSRSMAEGLELFDKMTTICVARDYTAIPRALNYVDRMYELASNLRNFCISEMERIRNDDYRPCFEAVDFHINMSAQATMVMAEMAIKNNDFPQAKALYRRVVTTFSGKGKFNAYAEQARFALDDLQDIKP